MTTFHTSPMLISVPQWAELLARCYGSPEKAITELNRVHISKSWLDSRDRDDRVYREAREDVLGQLALLAVSE